MSYNKHIVVTFLLVNILISLTSAMSKSPSPSPSPSPEANSKKDIAEQWSEDVNMCILLSTDTLEFYEQDINSMPNIRSGCEKHYNCVYYKKDC